MEIIDLSQPIQNGMTFFPGDPKPEIQPAEGAMTPWKVSDLRLGTHTGTHIDAASHFIPEGKTIDQYPVDRFLPTGMVISLPGLRDDQEISGEEIILRGEKFPPGGALLIQTYWNRYWNTARYLHHPFLSEQAVRCLMELQPSLVGIDALNVDSTDRSTDHVHRLLLGKDILIVENLTHLEKLKAGRLYQFSFLPLHLKSLDGSPIRAVAWSQETHSKEKN
jgi:arylformamidase